MSLEIWIFIAVFVLLDLLFIFLAFRKRKRFSGVEIAEFRSRWQNIRNLKGKEVILEADNLLHYFLKRKGFTGTMGEMLKRHGAVFSNLNDVWYVHKLRNRIAHEIDVRISDAEVKKSREIFRRAFGDLGLQ